MYTCVCAAYSAEYFELVFGIGSVQGRFQLVYTRGGRLGPLGLAMGAQLEEAVSSVGLVCGLQPFHQIQPLGARRTGETHSQRRVHVEETDAPTRLRVVGGVVDRLLVQIDCRLSEVRVQVHHLVASTSQSKCLSTG